MRFAKSDTVQKSLARLATLQLAAGRAALDMTGKAGRESAVVTSIAPHHPHEDTTAGRRRRCHRRPACVSLALESVLGLKLLFDRPESCCWRDAVVGLRRPEEPNLPPQHATDARPKACAAHVERMPSDITSWKN